MFKRWSFYLILNSLWYGNKVNLKKLGRRRILLGRTEQNTTIPHTSFSDYYLTFLLNCFFCLTYIATTSPISYFLLSLIMSNNKNKALVDDESTLMLLPIITMFMAEEERFSKTMVVGMDGALTPSRHQHTLSFLRQSH